MPPVKALARRKIGAKPGKASAKPAPKQHRNAEATRAAILAAALKEFAHEGVAGARTEEIARTAHVNKALIFYYFQDKETLHGAVLEAIFSGLHGRVLPAITSRGAPRERLAAYLNAHFDYVAQTPDYPRLVQWEMMRAGRGNTANLQTMVERHLRPIFGALVRLIEEGKRSGDFQPVDAPQFVPSMISVIVCHFVMKPTLQLVSGTDPLQPQAVAARKSAVIDMISRALLADNGAPARRQKGGSK